MKKRKLTKAQMREKMRALRAIPSEKRAEASRRAGLAPVKPGSRPRGRPRKVVTE